MDQVCKADKKSRESRDVPRDLTQKAKTLPLSNEGGSGNFRTRPPSTSHKKVTFKESPRERAYQPKRRKSLSPPYKASKRLDRSLENSNAEQYISMKDLDKSLTQRNQKSKHYKSSNKFQRKQRASLSTTEYDSFSPSGRPDSESSEARHQTRQGVHSSQKSQQITALESLDLAVGPRSKARENSIEERKDRSGGTAQDITKYNSTFDRAHVKNLQNKALSYLYRLKHYRYYDTTVSASKQQLEKATSDLKAIFDAFDAMKD